MKAEIEKLRRAVVIIANVSDCLKKKGKRSHGACKIKLDAVKLMIDKVEASL